MTIEEVNRHNMMIVGPCEYHTYEPVYTHVPVEHTLHSTRHTVNHRRCKECGMISLPPGATE